MKKNKILSVFLRIFLSGEMQAILFIAGVVFIYFLSPEGQPANRGEDGKGTWNLWVGLVFWGLTGLSSYFQFFPPNLKIENDPELEKLDQEIQNVIDSQVPYLLKVKKERPEDFAWMVKSGLVPKDLKDEDDDSIDESTSDPQSKEKNKS